MTDLLSVAPPVRGALAEGRPVVALETSVLAQGLPHPRNLEAYESMDASVRDTGAEPAWISVLDGRVVVGTPPEDLVRMATERRAMKVARRDLPMAVAARVIGATTVSATLWAARRAGIEVMATGGIGGVHLVSGDVSADLIELGRTPGTVVCSGPKSIVDPAATMERLEELGIGVMGYGCDRLPSFLVREADVPLEHRVDSPAGVAAVSRARRALDVESALLVFNPIPAEAAMDPDEVEDAVRSCLARASGQGVTGKSVTPFLLACIAERTAGRSVNANLALLVSNAGLAGRVAAELVGSG